MASPQTFDYIIIGAGSAGCVLANRLSEDPGNSVLLIEAGGPDKKMEIGIPGGYAKLHRSEVDWGFWTESQSFVNNRKLYLPRGKVLGGSSSTNAMAYVRGNRADFDEWAALGNSGWDYESVLPFFKKSEHNEDITNRYHGQGGPLNVTFAKNFQTPFAQAFVESCTEIGLTKNEDYNGERQEGAGFFQFTIQNGRRHSTAAAFLRPVLHRKNLQVFTRSAVQKILIQKDRAVGVEYVSGKSAVSQVFAKKEVILSAGAFQSPQLLMLSGIGEKEKLKKHGLELKKSLSGVGQNLQDHLFFPISALSSVQKGFNHELSPFNQLKNLVHYGITHQGVLTCSPLEAVAFYSIKPKKPVDFQIHFAPIQLGNDRNSDMYDLNTYPHQDGFTLLPSLLKPKSKGFVGIRSGNAQDAPLIQPNFLSEDEDLKSLVKGAKKALEILDTNAFKPFLSRLVYSLDPEDEEGLANHIREWVETIYHPVGTCKMGQDVDAVVDEKLRVKGIEGLRVADASIMPRIVAGNTNAAVIMIGEKAADMILNG
ncbi:choline dehydrogenase [Algoriphagus sp. oki45]|nr:choline dehydrogenase [Algoriphagus sp. oki45]